MIAMLQASQIGTMDILRAAPWYTLAVLGFGDGFEHMFGAGIEHGAVFGRHQLPGGAVEETHAEVLLQLLDPVRGDGRRDAHVAPGRRQIAEFDDPDENRDVVEIGHAAIRLIGFRAVFSSFF